MSGDDVRQGTPGVLPHQLKEWWETGPGAAKIRWGTHGDFDRCVRLAVEHAHMPPEQARGFCNRRHMAVLGKAPGQEKHSIDWAGLMERMKGPAMDDRANPKPYGNVKYADPKNGKYPIDTAAHAKAAWAYINQADNAAKYPLNGVTLAEVKARIMAACRKFGIQVAEAKSARPAGGLDVVRTADGLELDPDDGVLGTLHGRFTEFGRWYKVRSVLEGDFLERVDPGATADTIRDDRDSMRVLFDHGMDHQVGNKVLGPIAVLEEKEDGPRYEVPLFDTSYNRDLLPGLKAGVYGASMRMRVLGDTWDDEPERSQHNPDGIKQRTITRMRVMEFGPVTFPANPGATAGMRSATDDFYHRMAEHNPGAVAEACRVAGLSFEDFTGREHARSGPGGDPGGRPGEGRPSQLPSSAALQRARALRLEGII